MKRFPGLKRCLLIVFLLTLVASWSATVVADSTSPPPPPSGDETAVRSAIEAYHRGFQEKNAGVVRDALGDSLVMFNGDRSDDPTRWQAHMYLQGEDLDIWPSWMIAGLFVRDERNPD